MDLTTIFRSHSKLYELLSEVECLDDEINRITIGVTQRVWWAVFEREELSEEKSDKLQQDLSDTLHWALHIGESAWQLLSSHPVPPNDPSVDLCVVLDDLYRRPLIMMQQDAFDYMLRFISILWDPLAADPAQLRKWNRNTPFTRARLVDQGAVRDDDRNLESGTWAVVIHDLYRSARLYLQCLDWLVSTSERNRGKISDCFIALCANAMSMCGAALRLRWPM